MIHKIDLTQRLAGRVAVITGGASGIGLATAKRLDRRGREGRHRRRRRGHRARRPPSSSTASSCRSTSATRTRSTRSSTRRPRTYGSVDIAFNNAGISPPDDDSIETTELDAWDRVQRINLTSVYLCSRAALRHMVPAGRGSIINTASFVAVLGSATSQISLHRVEGRRARDEPRARRAVRPPGHPRQRALPGAGEHAAAARSCSRRTRSAPPAGSCTCRSVASPNRRSSRPRSPSSRATTRASSPRRRSSSTAASAPPT